MFLLKEGWILILIVLFAGCGPQKQLVDPGYSGGGAYPGSINLAHFGDLQKGHWVELALKNGERHQGNFLRTRYQITENYGARYAQRRDGLPNPGFLPQIGMIFLKADGVPGDSVSLLAFDYDGILFGSTDGGRDSLRYSQLLYIADAAGNRFEAITLVRLRDSGELPLRHQPCLLLKIKRSSRAFPLTQIEALQFSGAPRARREFGSFLAGALLVISALFLMISRALANTNSGWGS
ncbi:MAG TPA: hypothetical protein PKV71_08560 [Calditrichia bacterium]|nr:hypothetical protein [Calditrichota bacterium]HQU74183.1 hypothetical protein [Calditrichia bacterium]HQV31914.1 hypothetical protein [Calditrichia bacterium]